jgi:hypothetical protein
MLSRSLRESLSLVVLLYWRSIDGAVGDLTGLIAASHRHQHRFGAGAAQPQSRSYREGRQLTRRLGGNSAGARPTVRDTL